MTLELTLHTDAENRVTVTLEGQPLADPTPLADLPALPALQAAPYDQGRAADPRPGRRGAADPPG